MGKLMGAGVKRPKNLIEFSKKSIPSEEIIMLNCSEFLIYYNTDIRKSFRVKFQNQFTIVQLKKNSFLYLFKNECVPVPVPGTLSCFIRIREFCLPIIYSSNLILTVNF